MQSGWGPRVMTRTIRGSCLWPTNGIRPTYLMWGDNPESEHPDKVLACRPGGNESEAARDDRNHECQSDLQKVFVFHNKRQRDQY